MPFSMIPTAKPPLICKMSLLIKRFNCGFGSRRKDRKASMRSLGQKGLDTSAQRRSLCEKREPTHPSCSTTGSFTTSLAPNTRPSRASHPAALEVTSSTVFCAASTISSRFVTESVRSIIDSILLFRSFSMGCNDIYGIVDFVPICRLAPMGSAFAHKAVSRNTSVLTQLL